MLLRVTITRIPWPIVPSPVSKTGNRRFVLQNCCNDCFLRGRDWRHWIKHVTLEKPIVDINFTGHMDRGETYFHPHKHSTHDAFNVVTNEINYLQYDWNEKRVNARQDSEEFVRYYFRMSELSTIESSRVYTFTDLMTKIGGLYVLILVWVELLVLPSTLVSIRQFLH